MVIPALDAAHHHARLARLGSSSDTPLIVAIGNL